MESVEDGVCGELQRLLAVVAVLPVDFVEETAVAISAPGRVHAVVCRGDREADGVVFVVHVLCGHT